MICSTCGAKILSKRTWFDTHENGTCVGHLKGVLAPPPGVEVQMTITELQALIDKHDRLADHTLTLSIPRKSKLWYEFVSCPRWPSKVSADHDVILVTTGKARNAIFALSAKEACEDCWAKVMGHCPKCGAGPFQNSLVERADGHERSLPADKSPCGSGDGLGGEVTETTRREGKE